jgi:hypothetical protein
MPVIAYTLAMPTGGTRIHRNPESLACGILVQSRGILWGRDF